MSSVLPTLAQIERNTIVHRLFVFKGNKTQAAASLGISLRTLYNKLHKYGLMPL